MTMLKEFAQWLQEQAINPEDRHITVGNQDVIINADGDARVIEPQPEMTLADEAIRLSTLSSIVEYVKSGYDRQDKLMIQIYDPSHVSVFRHLEVNGERERLIIGQATLPSINFNRMMNVEALNIMLQANFVPTADRKILLQVIGNLKEENVKQVGDDGVSQSVTAKVGVAQVGEVKVPNPVNLAPYRTFSEVTQPVSSFIFRMSSGPSGALYEADGGAWRLEAIQNIKEYLVAALKQEIKDNKVMIIA